MKVSFNELKSMSKGAARGSGLSWGQAEEVSFATVWLLKNGFDVSNDLISLLESDIIYPPDNIDEDIWQNKGCLLYTSPSPRDATLSRMPSSA